MVDDPRLTLLTRLMDVAALKAQVHAGNIANQNTPGYKTRAVAFDQAFQDALASGGDDAALGVEPTVYEPRDTMEQPDGNDVSLNREIIESAKNQTLYNAYIAMARGKLRLLTIASSQAPGG